MSSPGKATVSRADYRAYIQSKEWRAVRERYWASKMPKECYCCGRPRHSGMHLHHRTYKNLGNERLMDLVPVCKGCHADIHYLYDNDEKWQKRGIWYATKAVRNRNMKANKSIAKKNLPKPMTVKMIFGDDESTTGNNKKG